MAASCASSAARPVARYSASSYLCSRSSPAMREGWVYVVDDDPDLRRSLEELIAVRGPWNVRSFPDGSAWLAAAEGMEPGCVLLDLNMPATTGLEVLDQMRRAGMVHQTVVL